MPATLPAMYSSFTAGDTFELTTPLAAYPATAGWVLKFRLLPRDSAGAPIAITCTASGADHLASVAATATAAWVPGAYTWSSWVELGAASHSIEQGQITLRPDPRTYSGALDGRSEAEIGLANVQAMLRGKASTGVQAYTINGRELRRYSVDDLLKLEAKLSADVKREQAAAAMASGLPSRRRIMVRLANA